MMDKQAVENIVVSISKSFSGSESTKDWDGKIIE